MKGLNASATQCNSHSIYYKYFSEQFCITQVLRHLKLQKICKAFLLAKLFHCFQFEIFQLWNEMKFRKTIFRSKRPGVFLGKGILKICSRFKGEHSCRNAISVKLLCNFIEIALRHGCSPVNLLHTFRTPFPETSGWLLLSKLLNLKSFKSILNTQVLNSCIFLFYETYCVNLDIQ